MSRNHAKLDQKRWEYTRRAVFERDSYKCRMCGRHGWLECDHVIPLKIAGDPWNMENLQTLDKHCHVKKTREENSPFLRNPVTKRWRALVSELR